MHQKISFLFIFLLLIGTYSCKNEKAKESLMPPITGRPGEVTLVMDQELYDGALGDSLYAFICQEELALPQSGMEGAEPMFDLIQIPPSAFGNMFRSNRNIIILTIDPEMEEPVIRIERDYWARNQLLIRMAASSKEQMSELIYQRGNFIVDTLRDTEINREIFFNNKFENSELKNQLLRNHQLTAQFPKGWLPRLDTGNFIWVEYTPPDITQGVLIKHYPYTSESQISYDGLIKDTDEWLQKSVPGPSDGSRMQLYLEAPIYSREFEKDGHYVREIKGLWEVKGDFMGGPYISWSFVDEKNNRIVTVFGFVYAPKFNKRNHIRKVESILHTVNFPTE